jgi:hypothetical protein
MSCGGPNTPTQNAAIAISFVSFAAIVVEGAFFAFRRLRPLGSVVIQVVKIFIVWGQWAVVLVHDTRGQARSSDEWKMAVGVSVLLTALS